jgi:hypothetical protein
MSLSSASSLKAALDSTPDVRTAEVDRAKALVADRAYPPPSTLEKLSALLAKHLESQP